MPKTRTFTLDEVLSGLHERRWPGVAEAKAAILSRIKEVVPEEKNYKGVEDHGDAGAVSGWNAYRTELLRRLEDL